MRLHARLLLGLLAAATLLVALVLGALFAWLFSDVLPPGTTLVIDGRRYLLHEWLPASAWHWLLAVLGLLLLSLLIALLVPLALVLALVLPAAAGALGLVLGLLALLLVASPLILLGWWLWRRRARRAPTTTMPA